MLCKWFIKWLMLVNEFIKWLILCKSKSKKVKEPISASSKKCVINNFKFKDPLHIFIVVHMLIKKRPINPPIPKTNPSITHASGNIIALHINTSNRVIYSIVEFLYQFTLVIGKYPHTIILMAWVYEFGVIGKTVALRR